MSLISLPEEVLETILLYVNVEDIQNVLVAVGHSGSEGFWKRICLINKYKNIPGEDETWESTFTRNISWLTGNYVKKEYNISKCPSGESNSNASNDLEDDNNKPSLSTVKDIANLVFDSPGMDIRHFSLKRNTLLFQEKNRVLLMEAGNPGVQIGSLKGKLFLNWCNKSRTKLLIRNKITAVVYSCDKNTYKEELVLNHFDIINNIHILTDHYFIILETARKSVTVFYFENNIEKYTFLISHEKVKPFNVCVFGQTLNILILDGTGYTLRRKDLERREWLEDIPLFGGASMIQVPQVRVNQGMLVYWTTGWEEPREVNLRIQTLEDEPRRTSQITLENENEFWLEMEANYLIYSCSTSSFSILNTKELDKLEITKMYMDNNNFLGKNIVSGFLILSFRNCFDVVDFKKGTYLYKVLFDNGLEYNQFCVNEYFYIVYNKSVYNNRSKKLCVYDFKG